ncbi:hypothetical protein CUMW_090310 [Citrus unshiu]|nr:hypothetical protein CUMW_090310 [Citrus unshiu]
MTMMMERSVGWQISTILLVLLLFFAYVIFATHKVSTVEATATITDAFAMKNVDSSIIKS